MALLLSDGFALHGGIPSAYKAKGWAGSNINGNYATGRASTSAATAVYGNGPGVLQHYIKDFPSWTAPVSIGSLALKWANSSGVATMTVIGMVPHIGTGVGAGVYGGTNNTTWDVGPDAIRLVVSPGTLTTQIRLKVVHGLIGGTVLADLGDFATNQWYHAEMWVNWTNDHVICRIDGSVRYDSGSGGVALVSPGATMTAVLGGITSGFGSVLNLADLLIMDGSGATFNGFQGDVIIETIRPTGDGTLSGWAPAPTAGTVTQKVLTSNVATLVVPGFATGDVVTVAGVDATFDGVHTVTAGSSGQISYSKVAANVPLTASGGTVTLTTPVSHASRVDEPVANDDGDYVTTSTVNALDTYAMQNLATSASSPVLAVRPVIVARKETAAAMGLALVVRSGGTNYPGTARDLLNTLVYSVESDFLLTDPATAAPWTRAAVDAIEVGPKKTA